MINLVDGREFAPEMVNRDRWVLSGDNKQVRAPWQTGNLYRTKWGSQLDDERMPTTEFEKAKSWVDANEDKYRILDGYDEVDTLHMAYLLSHEREDPEENIIMVDIDDVMEPGSEEILDEVSRILKTLNSYTEVSKSGEGFHVFVRGRLPEYINSLVEPLETDAQPLGEEVKIEIYEASRVCVATGQRVADYPAEIKHRDDVITDLVKQYYDDDRTVMEVLKDRQRDRKDSSHSGDSDTSPYYDVSPRDLIRGETGWQKTGNKLRGPHPKHGSTNGDNTSIKGKTWHCFRHDSEGNGLMLLAVLEGYLDCADCESGALDKLSDVEFCNVCLTARDKYGVSGKPPYRALRGAAIGANLMSEGDETLGIHYKTARQIYDEVEKV